jgi:hypothetical protein
MARPGGFVGSVDDVRRGGKVGLPDLEVDDLGILPGQLHDFAYAGDGHGTGDRRGKRVLVTDSSLLGVQCTSSFRVLLTQPLRSNVFGSITVSSIGVRLSLQRVREGLLERHRPSFIPCRLPRCLLQPGTGGQVWFRNARSAGVGGLHAVASCSHSLIEPSTSVKRKVTVPVGRSAMCSWRPPCPEPHYSIGPKDTLLRGHVLGSRRRSPSIDGSRCRLIRARAIV